MMITTSGKRPPAKVAQAERQAKQQQAKSKRPTKAVDKLTAQEKKDAIDAMLEWFMALE